MKSKTSVIPARHSDCWPPKNFRIVTALPGSRVPTLRVYPTSRRRLRTISFLRFFDLHGLIDERTWREIYLKRTGHSYGK